MDENRFREPFDMEDVPAKLWDGVYDKWSQALIDGWDSDELWSGCDLCSWVMSRDCGCAHCPLASGLWCTNFGAESKLSIQYCNWNEDVDAWRSRIEEFLIYLKPYCSENINKVKYE